jgi:hypothetical protein
MSANQSRDGHRLPLADLFERYGKLFVHSTAFLHLTIRMAVKTQVLRAFFFFLNIFCDEVSGNGVFVDGALLSDG